MRIVEAIFAMAERDLGDRWQAPARHRLWTQAISKDLLCSTGHEAAIKWPPSASLRLPLPGLDKSRRRQEFEPWSKMSAPKGGVALTFATALQDRVAPFSPLYDYAND